MSRASSDSYYLDRLMNALDDLGDIDDHEAAAAADTLRTWVNDGGDMVPNTVAEVTVTMTVPWSREYNEPRGPITIDVLSAGSPSVTGEEGEDVPEDSSQCNYWQQWLQGLVNGDRADIEFV